MNSFTLTGLQTEYLTKPLGLDVSKPRFSWQMESQEPGKEQRSYRITVSAAPGFTDVWDSGTVQSACSHAAEYQGTPLAPCTRYHWTVTVTDEKGERASADSLFETGFLDTGMDAWDGAKWIGAGVNNLQAGVKGVFSIESKFSIRQGAAAGLVFGANDSRLLDPYKNTFLTGGENYIAYVVDAERIPAKLKIFRVGYAPEDRADIPFFEREICDLTQPENTVITEQNRNLPHTLRVEVSGNCAKAYLDGRLIDEVEKPLPFAPETVLHEGRQLNPLGENDVITYPRLCSVGFYVSEGSEAVYQNLTVREFRAPGAVVFEETSGKENSVFSSCEGIRLTQGGFAVSGRIVTVDPSHSATPMLRRDIRLKEGVPAVSARLYITARGIYECHVGGQRVGEDWFQPGASQYDKHLYYQTYDITKHAKAGSFGVGVVLASGWWSDSQTFTVKNHHYFGDRPSLLMKISVTYADGSRESFVTDTENWQCSTEGPVRYASFFHGEHVDARLLEAFEDFSKFGFAQEFFVQPVEIIPSEIRTEQGAFHMWPDPNRTEPEILGQPDRPIRVIDERTALSVQEVRQGVFLYDMGQNMVGVPKIRLKGSAGQEITLRYCEITYPKLPEYGGLTGLPLMENLRDASCTDRYICKGDAHGETFMPRFTFHGYRYVEITGTDTPPVPEDVKGLVLSSITKQTGDFHCSDTLVNRFFENVLWSQRANFISIPTDCPQRNERMGWMGDAQVFAQTALYNADVRTLYYRYMQAVRDVQADNGRFADIAPIGGGFGGIVWGSAGLIVPFETYRQLGDVRILEENYAAMQKYMNYLERNYVRGLLKDGVGNLGDWLAADMSTDNDLIWNAYFAYDAKIIAEMAAVLGKETDAAHYAGLFSQLKQDWNSRFVDERGVTLKRDGTVNDTQCSYAVPLYFEVADDRNKKKMAENLVRKTKELGNTLTTGFVGTAPINQALSAYGYSETAYDLMRQRQYPSWLYSVTQGATTIWERWNSYTIDKGFGGLSGMNSFNHYSLGAVSAWIYRDVLGIKGDDSAPGYRSFVLEPSIMGFEHAKGFFDSPYGRIESGWEKDGGTGEIRWRIRIPANTEALVILPVRSATVDGALVDAAAYQNEKTGKTGYSLKLKSGRYVLTWNR